MGGHLKIRFVIHEVNPLPELGGASTSEPLRGTTGTLERCLPIFATFRSCGNLKHILLFMWVHTSPFVLTNRSPSAQALTALTAMRLPARLTRSRPPMPWTNTLVLGMGENAPLERAPFFKSFKRANSYTLPAQCTMLRARLPAKWPHKRVALTSTHTAGNQLGSYSTNGPTDMWWHPYYATSGMCVCLCKIFAIPLCGMLLHNICPRFCGTAFWSNKILWR